MEPHPQAKEISDKLAKEGIHYLYHFTDVENLAKIAQLGGLRCKSVLRREGHWEGVKPGGNELSHALNGKRGNLEYVHLNFTPYTPMAYNLKPESHLCFFCVSPSIASWQGIQFTDCNATDSDHTKGEGMVGLELVDFEEVRAVIRPWDRAWITGVQAEVLVPQTVPLSEIDHVSFVSPASLAYGERLWGHASHPPFAVDQSCFDNSPGHETPLVSFPFVDRVVLTPDVVTKETYTSKRKHQTVFERDVHEWVTAIATGPSAAGLAGAMRWTPLGKDTQFKFQRPSNYTWWDQVKVADLRNGVNTVELTLNGICWSKVDFTVK